MHAAHRQLAQGIALAILFAITCTASAFYDPTVGRWINRDSIEENGGRNVYQFVYNNAVSLRDPDGRKVQICCRNIDVNPVANCLAKICGAKHCWIKTDLKQAGMGPCKGDDLPTSPCCGTQTCIKDHSKETGATCYDVPGADENCVNNALQLGKSLGNWTSQNNCNSFTGGIVKDCGGKNACLRSNTITTYDWDGPHEITYCAEWVLPVENLPQ